jgi:hypothetical protein
VISVGWILVLVYDTLLFSMTVFKAYQARSQPEVKVIEKTSLFMIIIRDGESGPCCIRYFAMIRSSNTASVARLYIFWVRLPLPTGVSHPANLDESYRIMVFANLINVVTFFVSELP